MAEDANARIRVDIDTAAALANIKNLQRQISTFHTSLAKSGAQATASSLQLQQSLINGINKTGQFSAGIKTIKTTTDSFTNSLQKNKLSMGEYFRYSAAATKSFGRFFSSEFDTINKVARERVKDLQTQYIKMGRDANGAMRAIAVRPLALDMENLATKTQIAAQRQALLNQMLKQGSTNLLNFGKNTQWAGRQLMVGFTVPLVMLGSVAAKTFMDMEKQAVRFKRVYGEMFTTTEQTNKALADIKELANEFTRYGIAVSKTMELAADIAATGKMGAELNAQVAETSRLAVLGGVEQSKALEATISLTDAFGVSAEDLAEKIDFLNAVENQTITSIEDLTIAIPKAGPVVQQLGGDVEDLTFFLTAMREGGINASEGANALKSGLAALINPTGKASEMLQGFGINIKSIVESNAGDVKGLVIDFATALDGLDPLNRARAIEQLFGKFQFSRLSTLFQNVIKDGNQASRVLKLTNATTAELAVLSERELKKIEESPMFKFQKALEDIKVSLAPVGEAFLKAVTPLLEFGTKILKKFDELDENSKGFIVGLTAIAGVIGPVFLMGFGLIANGVANVIKGFVFFKTALNKAGSASTQLGMQTEYMTQQQLEAAAVAASLDQVHSKLKQTFTSEAAAINLLTAAYDRAIIKQAAFAGTPIAVGRGAKAAPKKYASGVISVPGPKGAGDIVPAMLSPGEAIIPAEKAEKYRGFIEALIAGNIPGFFSGTGNVAAPTPPKPERASNYIQGPFDKPIEESKKPADKPIEESKKPVQRRGSPENITTQAQMKRDYQAVYGKDAPKMLKYEAQIAAARQAAIKQEAERTSSWKNPNRKNSIPNLQQMHRSHVFPYDKRTDGNDKRFWRMGGPTRNTPNATNNLVSSFATSRQGNDFRNINALAPYLEKSGATPEQSKEIQRLLKGNAEPIGKLSPIFGKALSAMDKDVQSGKIPTSEKYKPGTVSPMMRTAGIAAADLKAKEAAIKKIEKQDAKAAAALRGNNKVEEQRANRIRQENSVAVQKDTKQVEKSTKEKVAATKAVKENKKETVKDTKSTKEVTAAKQKLATPATPPQTQRVTARETKAGTRYYSGNKLIADQKAGQMRYNRQQGAIKGAETRRVNAATKASVVPQQQSQARPQGAMGGKLGMAGMVASGAVMGASFLPGEVGKTAQNLMMPVMMLSMILPMLTSKFALIAAAVVGLIAAFVLVQMAIAGIRKESAELTRSMSSGKESMSKFAEFAGTVTASEYMEKRREQEISPFNVTTGKTTFGQAFIGSEDGTAMLESFEKQTEAFGRSKAIESLQKQLVTAVATGVLSTEQAQSIAKSLGQELNDYGITANINAAIQSIVGPDGKVLDGNTIQIYTEFIEGSTSGITGVGGILQSEEFTNNDNPFWWGDVERVAKQQGEAAGVIANFYDENQQIIDAFDAENLKNIDSLYDQGKYDEALTAEETYQKERAELIALYNSESAKLVSDFANADLDDQQAILGQLTVLAKELDVKSGEAASKLEKSSAIVGLKFNGTEESAALRMAANGALSAEDQATEAAFQQVKVQFLGELAAGNIKTETFNGLMEMFDPTTGKGQTTLSVLARISTEVGPQALDQLETVFEIMENPDQAAVLAAKIEIMATEDPDKAQDAINTLQQLATFDGIAIEPKVVLDFYGENPDKLEELAEKFEKLDHLAEQGKLDLTTLVEQKIITTGDMEGFAEHQKYFDSLEPEQQVKYMQVLITQRALVAENEIDAWFAGNPDSKKTRSQVADQLAHEAAEQYTVANPINDNTSFDDEEDTPSGGSSGPSASPLDDLLKKLRDVRKNQVGVTKGFEASANAINKLFGGGAGINLFSGLENDMRRLGAEEDLITLIAGMDPEEFEKKKNTLFNFDRQTGEIVGFKEQLQNIGRALASVALGQYVSDQQKSSKESRNQVLAFNQLRAAGYSVAEAYETVQDAAVASAVATGNVTREQLNTMLAELRAAQDAMRDAARLTPEGMQEVFEDGFNKAMEAFDAQEKKLTLEYELQIADDQKLIEDAQNQIAAIQYVIDDYEADLKGIEDQEKAINKTYDEKLEALEKVRKANQKILDQEKGKLSVAEAITRGDLSAAARAVQDVRATSASGYFSSQTDALNAGRQSALDAVRSENGLSRIEIEERIEQLANQIFEIEENTLEPAQRRVDLAGQELQSRIDELEVLGNTKTEWETIKNNIDVARTNSIGYKEAMNDALGIVQDTLDAWNGIQPRTVTLTVQTVYEGQTTPGNPGGPGGPGTGPTAAEIAAQELADKNAQLLAEQTAADAWNTQFEKVKTRARNMNSAIPSVYASDGIAKLLSNYNYAFTSAKLLNSSQEKAKAQTAYMALHNKLKARGFSSGGSVMSYMANGGSPLGSDTVPAMLTPGEFVMKRPMVNKYGTALFESLNSGSFPNIQNMRSPSFSSSMPSVSVNQSSVPSRQVASPSSNSVYNYSLSVNVASQSDPNTIAQTVMNQLTMIDSQRIRGNRF
jgi:TP901 family phage tail tape measure protein